LIIFPPKSVESKSCPINSRAALFYNDVLASKHFLAR
jgi:hypothetical protein